MKLLKKFDWVINLYYKHFNPSSPKAKWNQKNGYGEVVGDICCQRAAGKYCYEHNKNNY